MKIVQLIYTLSSGGAERFVVDLSNELQKKGHDLYVCILSDDRVKDFVFNKRFLNTNVKFYSLKFGRGFSLYKCIKVANYINSINPDIVHCHLNVIPFIFYLTLLNDKIKFIHTLHSEPEKCVGLKCQYYLNRYFYSHGFIHPVVISKECSDSYVSFYKHRNVNCIDNGRSQVEPTEHYNDICQEVTGYKRCNSTIVFTHIARFSPAKNQQLLIESFNQLDVDGVDFILLVIGNHFDDSEAVKLKNIACDRIYFLGEKNNIGDYLLCSNAFCLTSIWEGLPISLLEALSCGVIPICTSVGGIPNVIEDGITGYLSKNVTKEEYVNTIKRFLKHKISPMVLKQYFASNYLMSICAEKYLSLYECL